MPSEGLRKPYPSFWGLPHAKLPPHRLQRPPPGPDHRRHHRRRRRTRARERGGAQGLQHGLRAGSEAREEPLARLARQARPHPAPLGVLLPRGHRLPRLGGHPAARAVRVNFCRRALRSPPSPSPSLPRGREGNKAKKGTSLRCFLFFLPPLPLGEEGRGGEGFGGHAFPPLAPPSPAE